MSKFYMLVGLPASGKSTIAVNLFNSNINSRLRSSDGLRSELLNDINDMSRNGEIFDLLHSIIKADLYFERDTIYDATNLNADRRKEFLKSLSLLKCEKICIFVNTPYDICIERNLKRERVVPISVMEKMKDNLQKPDMSEGWNEIKEVTYDT